VTIGRSTWMSTGGARVDQFRWRWDDARLEYGVTELDLRDGENQVAWYSMGADPRVLMFYNGAETWAIK
jgi:hypothetical protein